MKLKLDRGQHLYFVSDTHYNHTNICKGTTKRTDPVTCREFNTVEEMNTILINNINSIVNQDDILFHLGDWSFGGFEQIEKFRNRLVCKNIHVILGNHDHHIERDKEGIQSIFSSVNKYLELTVKYNQDTILAGSANFVLMHYPIASWNNMARGSIHLHGHVHLPSDKRIGKGKMMDVGCDGNNLCPIGLSEILSLMKNQPVKSLLTFDHHEKSRML